MFCSAPTHNENLLLRMDFAVSGSDTPRCPNITLLKTSPSYCISLTLIYEWNSNFFLGNSRRSTSKNDTSSHATIFLTYPKLIVHIHIKYKGRKSYTNRNYTFHAIMYRQITLIPVVRCYNTTIELEHTTGAFNTTIITKSVTFLI